MPNNLVGEIGGNFFVKRVKDIYFGINERLFMPDPSKIIKIELGNTLGFNLEMGLVNFTLRIYLHYPETPNSILVDMQVENVFQVENLSTFKRDNGLIILPQHLIISIVSMSLSHGRALLFKNTSGTVFQEMILPVTNAQAVAKHFYPYMFDEAATVIQTDSNGQITHEAIFHRVPKKKNQK